VRVLGVAAADVSSCSGMLWDGGLGHWDNERWEGRKTGRARVTTNGRVNRLQTSISKCASFPNNFGGSSVYFSQILCEHDSHDGRVQGCRNVHHKDGLRALGYEGLAPGCAYGT